MIIYFPGCMATYRAQDIARATIELLRRAGVDFELLGKEEWCCGSVLLRTGDRTTAEEVARHNIKVLGDAGATAVVTSCAGCFRTLDKDYKEMFGKQDFEVVHFVDFLLSLIREGKLEFPEVNMKVTYHDPCHLGRHSGVYEAPREILKSVPGLELFEMAHNRQNAKCCGAGGGVRAARRELSDKMGDARLREAVDTGADVLTSACPFCTFALREAAERSGSKIKVLDLPELLLEILEIQ
jgi:Fe-S oxidoreductase